MLCAFSSSVSYNLNAVGFLSFIGSITKSEDYLVRYRILCKFYHSD